VIISEGFIASTATPVTIALIVEKYDDEFKCGSLPDHGRGRTLAITAVATVIATVSSRSPASRYRGSSRA
jgi:hypothetical protein